VKPLITVVMPVYNMAEYVSEAIESVRKQTYDFWELIIVNDGSIDSSEEIILSYSDNRIRYFRQENLGVAAARNVALRNMGGEYFCFLDADDIYPPDSLLSRLKVFLNSSEPVEFVDGRVEECDKNLEKRLRVFIPKLKGKPFASMLRLSEACYLGQTWMIRRNPGIEYRMREDLTHGEDFLFLLSLSRNGGNYDFTKETILLYRRHTSSAMSNLDGLDRGYRTILREIRSWPEVTRLQVLYFWLKSRKIMLLSFLFIEKSIGKAITSLLQLK
jgi:teichuronic acid biosynthesis glycosyltransferase TuaG